MEKLNICIHKYPFRQMKSPPPSERIKSSEMALEALSNVIKHNRGVDIQCIGHFKLLFSLLRLRRCPKIQEMALQVWIFFLYFSKEIPILKSSEVSD